MNDGLRYSPVVSDVDYDLVTIGAGSGGVAASRHAAALGAKVAIVEEGRVGGTCVLRGCVPKKLLVYASEYAGALVDAGGFGWEIGAHGLDWGRLIEAKDRELDRLNGIYLGMLERSGVTLHRGRGVLRGPGEVQVGDEVLRARHVLITTGGSPVVPDFPGSDLTMTSDEILSMRSLPATLLVIGGGYIGVEFACIFARVGVNVVQVVRGDGVLRGFDEDIRVHLAEEMRAGGVDLRVEETVRRVTRADAGSGYEVELGSGARLEVDAVLSATGRMPNTAGLGLESAGVDLGSRGEILVDAHSRTNLQGVFAVGDVTDRANLTPVAIADGRALADALFGDREVPVDHDCIPTAVFSQPEVGTVGLTEAEARARFGSLRIFETRFRPMRHTLSGRQTRVMLKLVVDAESDRVVGCHMVGEGVAEVVQAVAIALKGGATKAQFDATMALHPSMAEELVTMRAPSRF